MEQLEQLQLKEEARVLKEMLGTKYWEVFRRRAAELLAESQAGAVAPDHAGRSGSSEYRKGVYYGHLDILQLPDRFIQWAEQEEK